MGWVVLSKKTTKTQGGGTLRLWVMKRRKEKMLLFAPNPNSFWFRLFLFELGD